MTKCQGQWHYTSSSKMTDNREKKYSQRKSEITIEVADIAAEGY